jgi:hypothetical protein
VMGPRSRFYQRLLALDREEANELVAQQLEEKPLIEVCDTTLVPVLRLASADRLRGALESKRAACLFANLRDQISRLRDPRANAVADARDTVPGRVIHCVPAQDEADELGAFLFVKLLQNQGIPARQATVSDLAAIEHDHTTGQAIVCVSAISLPAVENARRLIKPLRACYPDLPILACLWDAPPQSQETDVAELEVAGATQVVTTLRDGLDVVTEWPQGPVPGPRIAEARMA